MKILFLNGSPRKKGFTIGAMKCIEKGIGSEHTNEYMILKIYNKNRNKEEDPII